MNSVVLLPARISLSAARPHLAGFLREAFRREQILRGLASCWPLPWRRPSSLISSTCAYSTASMSGPSR